MSNRVKTSIINKDKIFATIKTIVLSLVTGMLGFAIGWIFDGRVVLSIIVFSILAFFTLVAWVFTVIYEKSVSILSILNADIKHERYQEAVRLGYSVSRALYLSGKNKERYRISEKVCLALSYLDGTIMIDNKQVNVALLKSKLLIDECGWSLYIINQFENRKAAENRIKEGINQCLNQCATYDDEVLTYPIVFKGLRHLFGMVIHNFDETSIQTLQNNSFMLNQYIDLIKYYGGIYGFLLDESFMADLNNSELYSDVFNSISMGAKNSRLYFMNLKKWCYDHKKHDNSYNFSDYSPVIRYCLGIVKANRILNINEQNEMYLDYAKELAIKMTLGFASNPSDYDWLCHSISFVDCINRNIKYACKSPDSDRFVKGYVLVGTIAMYSNDLQSLEDARTAFLKAIIYSKRVNRVDTYISAQRKLISVNERIFRTKCDMDLFDKMDAQTNLDDLTDSMEQILKESKQFLGCSDRKMEESCKERRKEYRRIREKLKKAKGNDIIHLSARTGGQK